MTDKDAKGGRGQRKRVNLAKSVIRGQMVQTVDKGFQG